MVKKGISFLLIVIVPAHARFELGVIRGSSSDEAEDWESDIASSVIA
jgi:hypothetical protein